MRKEEYQVRGGQEQEKYQMGVGKRWAGAWKTSVER
jgi:hypothetical protein